MDMCDNEPNEKRVKSNNLSLDLKKAINIKHLLPSGSNNRMKICKRYSSNCRYYRNYAFYSLFVDKTKQTGDQWNVDNKVEQGIKNTRIICKTDLHLCRSENISRGTLFNWKSFILIWCPKEVF